MGFFLSLMYKYLYLIYYRGELILLYYFVNIVLFLLQSEIFILIDEMVELEEKYFFDDFLYGLFRICRYKFEMFEKMIK